MILGTPGILGMPRIPGILGILGVPGILGIPGVLGIPGILGIGGLRISNPGFYLDSNQGFQDPDVFRDSKIPEISMIIWDTIYENAILLKPDGRGTYY